MTIGIEYKEILQHRVRLTWRDKNPPNELDDCSVEHIEAMINEGYREGELAATGDDPESEHRGWWAIEQPNLDSQTVIDVSDDQDRTHLLQDWTVCYGADALLFPCKAENISHAIEQCENAYPGDVVVSAALDSIQNVSDFVVVGLPEACQMMVDGVLQSGPWFVIVDKRTGELTPDLIISDVACYLSRENAQEALEYNVAQYRLELALPIQQPNQAKTIGDLINTMPLWRNIEWDELVLSMPVDSECGKDCAAILTKGHDLASLCADTETELMAAVVRQVNVFVFG